MSVEYFEQDDARKKALEKQYEEADEYRIDAMSQVFEKVKKIRFAKALGTVRVSPSDVEDFQASPDDGVNLYFTSDTGTRVRIEIRSWVEIVGGEGV